MKAIVKVVIPTTLLVLILTSCNGFSSTTPTPSPKNVMETAVSVAFTMVVETQMALPATTWEEQFLLPNQWDGGLFSEEPCRAPCFAGILPGSTTESELMTIIKNNKYFQNCELKDTREQGRWISCKGLVININKEIGIADEIGFRTLSTFTLEEVVTKYGEPTTVWVADLGIHSPEYSMIVLFEDKKIRVDLEDQESSMDTYLLEPTAKIINIVYYNEENDGLTDFLQPWHGYGEYIEDSNWR